MQNAITQIGSFSFYSNKPVGQGATGLVYLGNKSFYVRISQFRQATSSSQSHQAAGYEHSSQEALT